MLQGAIIGAIVGVIMTGMFFLKKKGVAQAFLTPFNAGDNAAARAALEKKAPYKPKVTGYQLISLRERAAGLCMLGEFDTVERELDGLTGMYNIQVQVKAFALYALVLFTGGDALKRLEALADEVDAKGGITLKLIKKQVRAWAALGQATTEPTQLAQDQRQLLHNMVGSKGLTELVLWKGLAVALGKVGAENQQSKFTSMLKDVSPPLAE